MTIILSRTVAPGLFFLGFFLPMAESGLPQILILPIAKSSVVHKVLLKLFQWFSIVFCGNFESLLFPRTMEQRAPWKSIEAAKIGSKITVELSGGTARSLSSCTIGSPAQSSQRPNVAQRPAPPLNSTVILGPIPGTWSPGDEPGNPI